LIQERQQFHMEQLRAAEFRARQTAHYLQAQQQGQAVPEEVLQGGLKSTLEPMPLVTSVDVNFADMP